MTDSTRGERLSSPGSADQSPWYTKTEASDPPSAGEAAPGSAAVIVGRTWVVPGYTEVRPLGGGAFGEVVLATHNAQGTQVAIKYLHPDLLGDPVHVEMFRAEATALQGIDDPHVVRLYEYVETPAGAAIVMELVDGVSLQKILERNGKSTPEAALVVLFGSLLGLAAAHAKGVVHRDYKPANVLVSGQGASKLTDFGIAALAGNRPPAAGTLPYMPPEQFEGAAASPAADVYAATVTFYQCLTGHVPFDGRTVTEWHDKHKSAPVPLGEVPEPLQPVIARGLAKSPLFRPSDASLLAAELRDAAVRSYGLDWEDNGRSYLGEAALLLVLLWPSAGTSASSGFAVQQTQLTEPPRPAHPAQAGHPAQAAAHPAQVAHPGQTAAHQSQLSPAAKHDWHVRHVLHEEHLAHLRYLARERVEEGTGEEQSSGQRPRPRPRANMRLAIAGGAVVVVAAVVAGTTIALTSGGGGGGGGGSAAASISGTWQDQSGDSIQFVSSGPDAWTGQATHQASDMCLPLNVHLTGSGDDYHGTLDFYQDSNGVCGASDGTGTITFTLEPGGRTADAVIVSPTGGQASSTWTKQ